MEPTPPNAPVVIAASVPITWQATCTTDSEMTGLTLPGMIDEPGWIAGSISSLTNACIVLRERCVEGITANPDRMRWFVEHSVGIITALVPIIGYETSTEIAREALETGRGVYELVMERQLMTREELDRALNPEAMTRPSQITPAADVR